MKKQNMPAVFAGIGLVILILDTKTAIFGVTEGIEICLKALIPSLFPSLFLSIFLTASLLGKQIQLLKPIGRLLKIPSGAESILLIGLLGGYPVGAQCVTQAIDSGSISRENGKRMLAFCSNAGPAFIFGIGSRVFPDIWMCWALWSIHITAALLVGILAPGGDTSSVIMTTKKTPDSSGLLRQALQIMAMVCGWVVLFRVLLAFCHNWFLWAIPGVGQSLLAGALELANGCCALAQIEDIQMRFILCSAFLGFGGLCVTMQTFSICDRTVRNWYLPGKLLQTVFSIILANMVISREIALPSFLSLVSLFCTFWVLKCRVAKKDSNLHNCVV